MSDSPVSENAVIVERIFDAPVDVIWQMWTQAEHFKHWYGPQGFTVPVADIDVREGGKRLVCLNMQTPGGPMDMWTTGEYTEVLTNQRLVYTENMADAEGNILPPGDMNPGETVITVQLEDIDGRTKLTLTHAGIPAGSPGASGWEQALAKLAEHVKTLRDDS
ncbi:MAG: SRPBCC domain-containing protein [Chloroflexota bacterium]